MLNSKIKTYDLMTAKAVMNGFIGYLFENGNFSEKTFKKIIDLIFEFLKEVDKEDRIEIALMMKRWKWL